MSSKNSKEAGDLVAPPLPEDLSAALAATGAECAWQNLTAIGQRDFLGWINGAKLPETRQRRIDRCCENLVAGKRRPCCYSVVPLDLYKTFWDAPDLKASWSSLSASEKRDFSEWVEDSPDRETRKARIREAGVLLRAGQRSPQARNLHSR